MNRNWNPFSSGRNAAVLQQAEAGTAEGEPRMPGRPLDNRRRRNAGLPSHRMKELKQLQSENTRLKRLVTELKLDKSILQNLARLSSAGKQSS
jgi:putative transposase